MKLRVALAVMAVMAVVVSARPLLAQDAQARRMALLRGSCPLATLEDALDDPDVVVARTAARLLPARGERALPALREALRHDDALVRRNAAMNLGEIGPAALELVRAALKDRNELVRQGAVFALIGMPATPEVTELIEAAGRDESGVVQRAALLVTRAAYRTAESIRLPADGWRFRTDPEDVGREEEWFATDLDLSDWDTIAIEQFWGDASEAYADYTGYAWYRRTFELPERDAPARAQLQFGAVDESAWVWINGEFAGEHDIGPTGWDRPFRIDVTGLLNWGGENQITVRVHNIAMAGGIWKPVSVIILEPSD